MNIKKLLILFALMCVSLGASAAHIVHPFIGTLGPVTPGNPDSLVISEPFAAGTVNDIFPFIVDTGGQPSNAGASATSLTLFALDIPDFTFALSDALGDVFFTSFVGSGESVVIENIADGNYGLWFKGTAASGGGIVTGVVALTAVPIPAAVWLFGSALVGLFGVRRHTGKALTA